MTRAIALKDEATKLMSEAGALRDVFVTRQEGLANREQEIEQTVAALAEQRRVLDVRALEVGSKERELVAQQLSLASDKKKNLQMGGVSKAMAGTLSNTKTKSKRDASSDKGVSKAAPEPELPLPVDEVEQPAGSQASEEPGSKGTSRKRGRPASDAHGKDDAASSGPGRASRRRPVAHLPPIDEDTLVAADSVGAPAVPALEVGSLKEAEEPRPATSTKSRGRPPKASVSGGR
jgi:hypothetical protein